MNLYMTVVKDAVTGVSEEYVFLTEIECDTCYADKEVPAGGGWVGAFTMPEGEAKTLNQANADHYKN